MSLVITDGRDGRILVRCWGGGCDPRDILAELRRRRLLPRAVDHRPAPIPTRSGALDDTARRIAVARRIWDAAHDTRRSPVAAYLASRGITTDPPLALRWASAVRRPDGTNGPAMVARIDSIDGALIGISQSWLIRDDRGNWRRRDRAMLGRAAGGAVRLAAAGETLMIGEAVRGIGGDRPIRDEDAVQLAQTVRRVMTVKRLAVVAEIIAGLGERIVRGER